MVKKVAKSKTKSSKNSYDLKKEAQEFKKAFAGKLLDLMTSGFGLVAALAWNDVIREFIDTFIKPYFGEGSGLISGLIYAVFVTLLAVLVTYNLSKIAEKK